MRLLLIGSALGCFVIAVSPAVAHYAKDPYSRYHYASCVCHFGPADNSPVCVPTVSCYTQGGRCATRCPAQTGD